MYNKLVYLKMTDIVRKSKSWIQCLTDFIPRWPRVSNTNSTVVINKVPEKYPKANLSAPAMLEHRDHFEPDMDSSDSIENYQFHSTPQNQEPVPMREKSSKNKPEFLSRKTLINQETGPHGPEIENRVGYNRDHGFTRLDLEQRRQAFNGEQFSPNRPEFLSRERLINQEKGPYGPELDNKTGYNRNDGTIGWDFDPQKQVFLRDRKTREFLNGNEFPVHDRDHQANNEHYYDHFQPKGQFQNNYGNQNYANRRQKEPDKFEESKIDWSDYLHHFKTVANWNRWTYDEMGMQLAMCLKGDAQRIVTDSHKINGCIDYNTLISELNYRYNPAQSEYTYKMEFRARLKKSNETAMEYGYALRRLGSKAFPNISRECQEQLVLDQFVMGLVNIELKRHVQFGHAKDLNQAISLAAEFEAFDQKSLYKTFKPANSVMSIEPNSKNQSNNSDLKELCASLQDNTKELRNWKQMSNSDPVKAKVNPEKNLRKIIRCYYCNEEGHIQRNCPLNYDHRHNSSYNRNQNGNNKSLN